MSFRSGAQSSLQVAEEQLYASLLQDTVDASPGESHMHSGRHMLMITRALAKAATSKTTTLRDEKYPFLERY